MLNKDISLEDIASSDYKNRCKNNIYLSRGIHLQAKKMLMEYNKKKNEFYKKYKNKKINTNTRTKFEYITKSYWRDYYQKIRLDVIIHYSNGSLCCELKDVYPNSCGKNCVELLTIDHEGGHGIDHHKEINRSNIYHWLKKNNYPEGYTDKNGVFHRLRLLCHNCNHLERLRNQKEKDIELLNELTS